MFLIDDRGIGRDVFRLFAGRVALRDTYGTLETHREAENKASQYATRELSA